MNPRQAQGASLTEHDQEVKYTNKVSTFFQCTNKPPFTYIAHCVTITD